MGTLSKIFYKVKLKNLKTKIILLTTKITVITFVASNIIEAKFLIKNDINITMFQFKVIHNILPTKVKPK